MAPFVANPWTARCSGRRQIWRPNYSISNITIMAIERMQGWTGARQNRAWTDLARLSVSVLIVGGNTVVGYIRHPWRHDVRQTTGCIFAYAFRDLSNLRWTVEFTTDCGGHDNMNEMDAEVTHLRILANLKTREIVPQFNLAIRHPPTGSPFPIIALSTSKRAK